jgi:hypothetical protein
MQIIFIVIYLLFCVSYLLIIPVNMCSTRLPTKPTQSFTIFIYLSSYRSGDTNTFNSQMINDVDVILKISHFSSLSMIIIIMMLICTYIHRCYCRCYSFEHASTVENGKLLMNIEIKGETHYRR